MGFYRREVDREGGFLGPSSLLVLPPLGISTLEISPLRVGDCPESSSPGLPGPPSGHEGPGNGRLKASFLSPSSRQENAVGCQVEDLRYAEESVFGIFYLLNHIDGFPGLKGPSAAKVVEEGFLVSHFVSNLDDLLIFN